ncbi:vesicular glutamate transporter 1, partial [Plakobranchus ocellatus]
NATLSAVPYAMSWVVKQITGRAADALRRKGYLSTKNTRKLFNSLGSFLPAIMVLIVGYVGSNHVMAVAAVTLCVGLSGLAAAGYNVNHLDIAPKYSGKLHFTYTN